MEFRVHPRFFVRALDDEVHFLAEDEYQLLEARLFPLLVPLLDGSRSFDDLLRALEGIAGPVDIQWGLEYLARRRLLDDGSGASSQFQERRELAVAPLLLRDLCGPSVNRFLDSLPGHGITFSSSGAAALVVTPDLLEPALEHIHEEMLSARRRWIPLCHRGSLLFLGPSVNPPDTPCWPCIAARLRDNPRYRLFAGEHPQEPGLESAAAAAALLRECLDATASVMLVFEPGTARLQRHCVSATPGCHHCARDDSGAGSTAPAMRYERFVSPLTGLVASLRVLPVSGDSPYCCAEALHGFSLKLSSDNVVRGSYRYSLGKGRSAAEARTGALCEALERCSGFFRAGKAVLKAPWRDIEETGVHPATLLLFSDAQYLRREEWNRAEADFNWVPEPFDEDRHIEWASAWSFSQSRVRHLPASWCYYGYPADPAHDFCRADSNGNAAGVTLASALFSGLMEVVERDSVALWWYNRLSRPGIDLAGFCADDFDRFRDFLLARERHLWVLDLTADLGIPAVAALSTGPESPFDLLLGFGAHLDAERAIRSALTELFQICVAAETQDLPGLFPGESSLPRWLLPSGKSNVRLKSDYPRLYRGDACLDIALCADLLRERGLELIVLNQTRREIGLPVVKAVVPGMRPFWARLGPGRLYDVPVRLGWIAEPRREEDLNPVHLKF